MKHHLQASAIAACVISMLLSYILYCRDIIHAPLIFNVSLIYSHAMMVSFGLFCEKYNNTNGYWIAFAIEIFWTAVSAILGIVTLFWPFIIPIHKADIVSMRVIFPLLQIGLFVVIWLIVNIAGVVRETAQQKPNENRKNLPQMNADSHR